MSQDYHIYIHGGYGGGTSLGNKSPAKPSNFSEFGSNGNIAKPWQQAAQFISNPDSLIGVAKQKAMTAIQNSDLSIVAKAIPFVAIAKAALEIIDSVADNTTQMIGLTYGKYGSSVAYHNIKQAVGFVLSPIGSTMSAIRTRIQIGNQNERNSLQAELLGDSQLNTNYKRRV